MKRLLFVIFVISILGVQRADGVDGSLAVAILSMGGSGAGGYASDTDIGQLICALSRYGFIRLIERDRIDIVLREQSLGQIGVVNEATAAKTGRVLGAEIIVIAIRTGNTITVRAIHAETALVIAKAVAVESGDIPSAADSIAYDLGTHLARENLKRVRNNNPAIHLDFQAEIGDSRPDKKNNINGEGWAKTGDAVRFTFMSDRDGYLTIVDIQPDGEVVLLYPNEYHPSNEIKAGTRYVIPGKDDGFMIHFTRPAGKDTVAAFFTVKRVDWLDGKTLGGKGFWTVRSGERVAAARGMTVVASRLGEQEWKSACIEIEVRE